MTTNNNIILFPLEQPPQADLLHFFGGQNYLRNPYSELPAPLYLAENTTSSLDLAHPLIEEDKFPPFSSLLCRSQTSGRGQLRRAWASPEGNIYAALSLPNTAPFSSEAAAPALGAMISHALNQLGYEVFLKWPNDIIQKQGDTYYKVGGILLEERNNALIAGIGINITSAPKKDDLRQDFFMEAGLLKIRADKEKEAKEKEKLFFENILNQVPNGSFFLEKIPNNNNEINSNFIKIIPLWLFLVEKIFLCYRDIILKKTKKNHFSSWQAMAKHYLAFEGEVVKIIHPLIKEEIANVVFYRGNGDNQEEYICGRLCGISPLGELLLQTDHGLLTIIGGSFSHK